ncbi:hypothetical protein ACT691_06975 [Vibrio metschnikovii]
MAVSENSVLGFQQQRQYRLKLYQYQYQTSVKGWAVVVQCAMISFSNEKRPRDL